MNCHKIRGVEATILDIKGVCRNGGASLLLHISFRVFDLITWGGVLALIDKDNHSPDTISFEDEESSKNTIEFVDAIYEENLHSINTRDNVFLDFEIEGFKIQKIFIRSKE